jgi:membrane-associated phospholipid phosphatase
VTTPSFLRPLAALNSRFLWPLGAGLLLAIVCAHPLWRNRTAQLAGDFGSHTLYQGFLGLAAAWLLWQSYKSKSWRYFWWLLAVSLVTALCVEGLKRATGLPRPDGEPSGFPSGHTTIVFAMAWLLTQVFPQRASLWYGVAVSVGWSRVEGHAHFPYQVLCGALLGTAIGWSVVTCRIEGRRDRSRV